MCRVIDFNIKSRKVTRRFLIANFAVCHFESLSNILFISTSRALNLSVVFSYNHNHVFAYSKFACTIAGHMPI